MKVYVIQIGKANECPEEVKVFATLPSAMDELPDGFEERWHSGFTFYAENREKHMYFAVSECKVRDMKEN